MPSMWGRIEDASSSPQRIWFSKVKDADPWKPLYKSDCRALNDRGDENFIVIEGGRATVDIKKGTIQNNYYANVERKVTSALWFEVEKGDKEILTPITQQDEDIIEGLYQQAIQDSSSLGRGIGSVLKKEIPLVDDESSKVYINRSASVLSMRKKSKGLIALGSTELQRGYGPYEVDGELEETELGPIRHLTFVIHGIGEAVWSREDVMISGWTDTMDQVRITMNKKQHESWKKECARKIKAGEEPPEPPSRVEIIPIEWFDKIHDSTSQLKNTLLSTTLSTIPKLRVVANDIVFDVLMYLTPEFCEKVLTTVTDQICTFYENFKGIHTDFEQEGGKCSLIGHSLGSVIAWDVLCVLQDNAGSPSSPLKKSGDDSKPNLSLPVSSNAHRISLSENDQEVGTWGPLLKKKMKKSIPFTPAFTFFLGSPLGLFLTLRGAKHRFKEMIDTSISFEEASNGNIDMICPSSSFCLPSKSVYNIFHPSDPVAYRIEPLLVPDDVSDSEMPPPAFLAPDRTGKRLHVKAMELGDTLSRTFNGMFQNKLETIPDAKGGISSKGSWDKRTKFNFALGGESVGNRVDFQLQPGVVDNEYLSALAAHSSYFWNDDVLEFLIQCSKDVNQSER